MRKILIAGTLIFLTWVTFAQQKEGDHIPVYLNHFFLVLDSQTYADIEKSDFLKKEFAVFEKRTTVSSDLSYTGIYFYGTYTYFEFFDALKAKNVPVSSGIALGVDHQGQLLQLKERMSKELTSMLYKTTRQWENRQLPWFSGLILEQSLGKSVYTWLMEYDPLFLQEWQPQKDSSNQGVTRKQILERYASVLKDKPAQPLLEDVVELTAAVDQTTQDYITKVYKLWGYRPITNQKTTTLVGPEIKIHLKLDSSLKVRGIQQVKLKVRGTPNQNTVFTFGKGSTLKFHGNGFATWYFHPLPRSGKPLRDKK